MRGYDRILSLDSFKYNKIEEKDLVGREKGGKRKEAVKKERSRFTPDELDVKLNNFGKLRNEE